MPPITIEQIRRYPVKSMGGEVLESVELTANGLVGDRAWAVRDEVRGQIVGAKKIAALMRFKARYAQPPAALGSSPAEIMFPDGATATTTDENISARLSTALDHTVTLWPLLPADALDHYRRAPTTSDKPEAELREALGRTPDEPLPDLSRFPPELLEFESPPGTYFDAFPVLLISQSSLDALARARPESRFDICRFRPNFLLDVPDADAPFPELAWEGRRARLGTAVLRMTIACPRCVMTTHGFDDLPKDPGVMRALVKQAGGNLGIGATVEQPGTVRVGDAVEVVRE
jgi:MOSC domain-containing protein